ERPAMVAWCLWISKRMRCCWSSTYKKEWTIRDWVSGTIPARRRISSACCKLGARAVGPSSTCGTIRPYPSEEPHLDSGALLLLSSPRRGGEGGEALDGNVSNTWQDGGLVVADRNLHPAAALHDRQNRRHLRSGLLAADVDPVL